jgi:DNA-binding NarL/FixJ family response regulator
MFPGWGQGLVMTLSADPAGQPRQPTLLSLAVVDDHEVFRLGLKRLLSREQGVQVAWDVSTAHDAFERLQRQPVDAVLMDINLGGPVDGLQATRRMVAAWPNLKVILISGLTDERRLAAARQAGATGFLPKELSAVQMVEAIVRMVSGRVAPGVGSFHPAGPVLAPLAEEGGGSAFEDLSPREIEVLGEVRWARTNREIAERLGVSTTTVNKHVHQILRKLGVRNRAEAAIVAAKLLSQPRQVL